MSVLLHISDTHFGTEEESVVEALHRLRERLQPDAAILSGDITQRARRAQFDAARRFVERLALPTLIVPGNHDIPLYNLLGRIFAPYAGYVRVFGHELEPELQLADTLMIGVNSTKPWRHKHGHLTPAQIARVAERLQQAPDHCLRLVVLHHPIIAIEAHDLRNVVRHRAAAAAAWAQAGAHLVLGGHIHLPYVVRLPAVDGAPRLWGVQAGTAVSRRRRGGIPNSVNVLRTASGACTVERFDYSDDRRTFERGAVHELTAAAQAGQ